MTGAFLIAETYLSKEELVKVAKCVLLAQDIREESWDETRGRYRLNNDEATVQAANKIGLVIVWQYIISEWLWLMWNESQEWAQEILNKYSPDNGVSS